MMPKPLIKSWIQKFLYSWLIFCVGGVSSLTYFDGLLPGHEHWQHAYHLSIFEESPHAHNPLPSTGEVLAEQVRFWLVNRMNSQADMLSAIQSSADGFTRFFTSRLSDGYILSAAHAKFFDLLILCGLVSLAMLSKRSAWLSPPDKPPIFLA